MLDREEIDKWLQLHLTPGSYTRNYDVTPHGVKYYGHFTLTSKAPTNIAMKDRVLSLTKLPFKLSFVEKDLDINHTGLATLENFPHTVGGYCSIENNKLTSLKGCPTLATKMFSFENNPISEIDALPEYVGNRIFFGGTHVSNLHNMHKLVKQMNGCFECDVLNITQSVLSILLIDGCNGIRDVEMRDAVSTPKAKWVEILNKYAGRETEAERKNAVFACQAELIHAGFRDYARI